MKDVMIIAPHPDDEIIGCYSFLDRAACICYCSPMGQKELYDRASIFGCETRSINEDSKILRNQAILLFPDPYFETHPTHRQWGAIGEQILRRHRNLRVIFYSVNMQAPYIFEAPNPKKKRALLNTVYPEKSDLWKYDHKYFLFEGYCEWMLGRTHICD
jgi:hypothetical protein